MVELRQSDESVVTLSVRVQPKASRNQLLGEYDGALKIALTAPPVDGAANKALCAYIAKLLGTAKSNVRIVAGETGRNKTIAVSNVAIEMIRAALGV